MPGDAVPADASLYQIAADLVLVAHFGIVVFVVGALPLIVVGNRRGWAWVNALAFRIAHLLAIPVVVAGSWLGIACPLTMLENRLRAAAGGEAYAESFIEHWLQRLLSEQAPGQADIGPDAGWVCHGLDLRQHREAHYQCVEEEGEAGERLPDGFVR